MQNKSARKYSKQGKKSHEFFIKVVVFTGLLIFVNGCNRPPTPFITDYGTEESSDPLQIRGLKILTESLNDPEPIIRVHAVEAVVDTGQYRLMSTVQLLLSDQSMPVRFAAAVAIGDMKYTIARHSVSLALEDPDHNVIVAASYAMGRLGDTEYYEVIRKALTSTDLTVRANAAFLLGKIGDPRVIKLLQQAQKDKTSDTKVRYQALEARAELGDQTVLKKLWAMVYGYSEDRMIGVRAMGALGSAKAKEILITKLDDDLLEVRLAAAGQLGKLGDRSGESEVLMVFEENLTSGPDEAAIIRTKVLTAIAISQICTSGLIKHLPELIEDKSKSVRIAAARAALKCRTR